MKKVLSLVLAAAMAMGVTATAFAAKDVVDTSSVTSVGDKAFSKLNKDDNVISSDEIIDPGDNITLTYSVAAVGKKAISSYNVDADVKVKGPGEISEARVVRNSFVCTNIGTDKYLTTFEVSFKLTANNDAATDLKDLVLTYGYKLQDASGTGYKSDTVKTSDSGREQHILAGYDPDPSDELYDAVVEGYDDMDDAGDDSFEVVMQNPVLPTSVIKFLQRNLGNSESVIFVKDGDSVYFEDGTSLELTGKEVKTLSSSKHISINVNEDGVDEISDVLDGADLDYKWFNYATHQTTTGIHSFGSGYTNPYVYLVNDEDGSLTEVELVEYDYGDVAFSGPMGRYVVTEGAIPEDLFEDDTTDEPIEDDDDLIDEPTEDDDNLVDEDGNPIENNPGTGSSNAISLAVAMAVVSLAAAGLVASKKASK